MSQRLAGKVAIVTGAGAVGPGWGNGRATAVLFAREGARVLVVDCDAQAAQATADIIRGEGNVCEVAVVDVTDEQSVVEMTTRCVRTWGKVDVLHNNVGASVPGGPEEMSVGEFRAQIDLNLTSVFLTTRAVLPNMAARKTGAIVNVGSIGAMRHLGHDHVGYSAGKAALVQFTRQLAVRYGPAGIRCNSVIPGLIDTPLLEHRVARQKGRADLKTLLGEAAKRVPLGHRGDGWDVAYAALFLACDEAKYITGTEILVDGGLMARSA